ncbi:LCP family protein [Eubacterium limosum]|uniref:LCP family protein n=1 Tax=Eubacterium limosum TaxID=1736 RepID=A0ABT5UUV7_EUBLI|nr:LCP family protein [Eubacterium limosum]MCB6572122.1 LCP family protein [Eubacterium limosum]MDE1472754.1 LCP family protein [Eubacterium limosum]
MTLKKKVLCIVLACLIIVVGSGAVYGFSILHGIAGEQLDESDLNINDLLNDDVANIALFGIDGRDDVEGDRSDTIMIASINFKTGAIKVTSVMRDLLVKIPEGSKNDVSYEKINAAYDYGGPQLAVKTLNENFDLNISDYVVVNFDCLVDTVDTLGGVDVNIENEDVLYWTNEFINHVNYVLNKSDPKIEGVGTQHLTGVQALAYCRNRYSDDDYKRTARQREVVQQIVQKALNVDLFTGINLLGKVYPYVKTSLSLQEMTTYAKAFMTVENKTFTDYRIPLDDLSFGEMIDEVWYLVPNSLADNAVMLHKFLYESESYTPTTNLLKISERVAGIAGSGSGGVTVDEDAPYQKYSNSNENDSTEPTPSMDNSYDSSGNNSYDNSDNSSDNSDYAPPSEDYTPSGDSSTSGTPDESTDSAE